MTSNLTQSELEKAVKLAVEVKSKAYCPYSNFQVGSTAITKTGEMYTGINIENANYCNTVCAERTAIGKAVTDGHKEFKAFVVSTNTNRFKWPCGMCRQSICEFATDDCEIISVNASGSHEVKKFSDIHPSAFTKKDLQD